MAEWRFFNEGSIPEFLAALAAPDDPHGAVAAAAVAGAMGTSLLEMVAALPQAGGHGDDDQSAVVGAASALARIREELLETVETETAVRLFAARKMSQITTNERAERESAIQFALRAATDVPLEVMRLCGSALGCAETVAAHSARPTAPDVELAVAMIEAAFNAARSHVEAKLSNLTDPVLVKSVGEELARLSQAAAGAVDAARSSITVPPT